MPARLDRRALAVAAALATVYLVWGSTYLGIALALETMPPLLMAGARFLVAGALLYALARRFDRGAARPDRAQWLAAAITGTFLLGLGNGGVVWAQQTVPSGVAALVIASIPLWIALLGRAFQSGMLAITSAATPEGTVCCAHTTPPLPRPSRNAPVIAAASHWCRSGRAAPPSNRRATA